MRVSGQNFVRQAMTGQAAPESSTAICVAKVGGKIDVVQRGNDRPAEAFQQLQDFQLMADIEMIWSVRRG